MKKLRSAKGFTLIEILVSMLILTFLVIGMGPGMKTALTVYQESTFQSSSTALIGTVNATLGDVLRYAEDVRIVTPVEEGEENTFTFSNADYGMQNATLMLSESGDKVIVVKDHNGNELPLLPEGAYPNMEITDFSAVYSGGVFRILYSIQSTLDVDLKRENISYVIAPLNSIE